MLNEEEADRLVDELRKLAARYAGPGVDRADVRLDLRQNRRAQNIRERLRVLGLSNAEIDRRIFAPGDG